MLPEVVEDLKRKDLVTESDGALCVFTDISETPLIIQKADGGFGYDSTDCAAVRQRVQEMKAQRVIYVIDNGQEWIKGLGERGCFFLPGPSFSKTTEDHIYGLATDFTSFYTECFVIGSEQEKSRLLLLEVVRRQLAQCLGFLRIQPFEKL
eukprot:g10588.t1